MNHDDYKRTTVPIRTSSTETIFWHPAIDAHCLLAGGTAEDRAVLIDSIAEAFVTAGWSVQRGESATKQQEIITDIWVLMEQRFDQHMSDPTARDQWDPILLVIDEQDGGIAPTTASKDQLRDLVALTRSAKIHVLVAVSNPPASLLTGEMRDSIAVRIPVDAAARDHQLMKV